ncbi:AroM family protein [Thermotoga profunda]|uniref:AroM family protein n=1 Tax=Thermotoga profunda TaxID=1508420 RepID=UPI00059765C7|nr:AroM family protein [Thermotoga profunda]
MLFITIGESPRNDVIPELMKIIGKDFAYREIGLIDNVEPSIYAPMGPDDLLVSRKNDGTISYISHKWVCKKLSKMVFDEPTVLLCTAKFDNDRLILPYKVINSFFQALPKVQNATVIVPQKDQCKDAMKRWNEIAQKVNCIAFSPYTEDHLDFDLTDQQLIYLDCIGYTLEHEKFFRRYTKGIVLSARRILGNYLRTLL